MSSARVNARRSFFPPKTQKKRPLATVVNQPLTISWANLAVGSTRIPCELGIILDAATLPSIRPGALAAPAQATGSRDRHRHDASASGYQGARHSGNPAFGLPNLGDVGALLKRGDIALAIGVMAI